MNIHFIVAPSTHLRPLMKALSQQHHITILPEELSSETHYVIADPHLSPTHPDLLLAQNLGLSPISPNAFLYEFFKNKTRVVLSGNKGKKECLALVLHTMDFYNQPLSYCLETPIYGKQVYFNDTEFVLFEGDDNSAALHPTIALITDIDNKKVEEYHNFIESITKGGILIYNEEDEVLKTLVENNERAIRKMEYRTPLFETHNGETFLITLEGELPLGDTSATQISHIEAAKWVCQNMGIDEADFYEAMVSF